MLLCECVRQAVIQVSAMVAQQVVTRRSLAAPVLMCANSVSMASIVA